MIEVFKPPRRRSRVSMFLAGSIEMGAAEEWQNSFTELIKERFDDSDVNLDIFNPRRDDWDNAWEQSIHHQEFRNQVEWELYYLHKADIKIFYFDPATKSPITLMELGLMLPLQAQKCLVCCPVGFWRKGNVDITCHSLGVKVLENINELAHSAAIMALSTSGEEKP